MRCSDLYSFAQIAEAVVAPDGDAVAYVRRTAEASGYNFELVVVPVPGMPWRGHTGPAGTGLRNPAWSPDGRRLAAVEQVPGETAASLVVFSPFDRTSRRLITGLTGPASIRWAPNGREIAFLAITPSHEPRLRAQAAPPHPVMAPMVISNLSAKVDGLGTASAWCRHIFTVSCGTGNLRQLTAGDLWVEDFCYSPSGLIAFCGSGPYSGVIPRQPGAIRPCGVWLLSQPGQPAKQLTTAEVSSRCPAFATDSHVVFVGLPRLRADLPGLFTVPAAGGPGRRLAGELDRGLVTGSASFQGGHPPVTTAEEVLFCARDGGCVQLYEASLRTPARVRKIAGSAAESISAVSASRSGTSLAYVSSTADGWQRLTILDRRSGNQATVAEARPPAQVVAAAPRRFTARDGVKLEGWLIRRPGTGRTPLLIDVHGGSFSGAWSPLIQPSRLYQQELAESGWTILLLNARGSDGYGTQFARAAVGAWGAADAPDYHDAINALVREQVADPARLAVTGYSYGGFMSNWLTATSDRFAAAVAGGSICDFVSLFGTSDMGWVMSEYDIGVRPQVDPSNALKRSPIGLGRPVHTPTLLLHGEADLRCPISQAEEWLAMLLSSGCKAALVRYPSASHNFLTNGPPSFTVDYGTRLIKWVTDHVAGTAPHQVAKT